MTGVEVNVYSDSSVRSLHEGAWGAVVVRPGEEPFEASGKLRWPTPSSLHGEAKAAANAIHAALQRGLIKPGDRVVVRCDNINIVERIRGGRLNGRKKPLKPRADLAPILDWIRDIAAARGFEITAAWVRGHQPMSSLDPHARHNGRADHLCGRVALTRKVLKSRRRPSKRTRAKIRRRAMEKGEA